MSKEIIVILVLLLFSSFAYAQEESITITTYYPSPYGSYRELSTQRLKVGRTYPTVAVADDDLIVEGRVGIGTTNPTQTLDVNGQLRIQGGNPAQGRVLTSDANGVGTWQSVPWPEGKYCIIQAHDQGCPAGFEVINPTHVDRHTNFDSNRGVIYGGRSSGWESVKRERADDTA